MLEQSTRKNSIHDTESVIFFNAILKTKVIDSGYKNTNSNFRSVVIRVRISEKTNPGIYEIIIKIDLKECNSGINQVYFKDQMFPCNLYVSVSSFHHHHLNPNLHQDSIYVYLIPNPQCQHHLVQLFWPFLVLFQWLLFSFH